MLACVVALTLVGGALAMEVALRSRHLHTARFGETFADPLAKAFVKAWNTFPRPGFVSRLVEGLQTLNLLNASEESLSHLEGLGAATGLLQFSAYLDDGVSLESLLECSQLERLTLSLEPPDDLSSLATLAKMIEDGVEVSIHGQPIPRRLHPAARALFK